MSQHNQMRLSMFLHNLWVCFKATKCIAGKLLAFLIHSPETDERYCKSIQWQTKPPSANKVVLEQKDALGAVLP